MIRFDTSDSGPQVRGPVSRRGLMITEGIVACLITGAAVALLIPVLISGGHQRQLARFEILARTELCNLNGVAGESGIAELRLSDWFASRYPDARLTHELVEQQVVFSGQKAVRLTISRPQNSGAPDARVSLVFWIPDQEVAP